MPEVIRQLRVLNHTRAVCETERFQKNTAIKYSTPTLFSFSHVRTTLKSSEGCWKNSEESLDVDEPLADKELVKTVIEKVGSVNNGLGVQEYLKRDRQQNSRIILYNN